MQRLVLVPLFVWTEKYEGGDCGLLRLRLLSWQALCGFLTVTRIGNALYRGISVGLFVMVCFVNDGRI